eukprot:CAMPEP_0171294950 /NCGR_PEP_ID=MMETSP0816-20121228/3490_1 /TAXON_ID=420281 /ORGANISM="Proboscia inermis, Strain CCAP1064/1" /LENGTH=229 /DNA_ID=CAMNT_0011767203 /DNA_START=12 /DNA_END=701 /DNA_ORIENTATION=+
MAKKKKSSPPEAKATEVVEAEEVEDNDEVNDDEEDALELLQVDTGDIIKLKQVLDETVAGTYLDGEQPLLEEDHALENVKLSLMALACMFAVVAQFSPMPFPESRMMLGVCCVSYFILSGILQLLVTFIEKDAIIITKPPTSGKFKRKDKGLRIRTDMPRFDEHYTLIIEYEGVPDSPYTKETWSVGKLFDVEGMFDEIFFMEEVEAVLKRFGKGQYDQEADSSKVKNS